MNVVKDRTETRLFKKTMATCVRLERQFVAGNKGALLEAVRVCLINDVPVPRWAVRAFSRAWWQTKMGPPLHKSWDEVFGRPHAKGEHLDRKMQARKFTWLVYGAMLDLRARHPRKDHFQTVADHFTISRGTCKKYFDAANKIARTTQIGKLKIISRVPVAINKNRPAVTKKKNS